MDNKKIGSLFSKIFSYLWKIILIAVIYFVSAKFGLSLAFTTKQVTTVWPPTGIALAILLIGGYRYWPGIAMGAFVANLLTGETSAVALGIMIGNTLEAVTGAYLLNRLVGFDIKMSRIKDIIGFIFFGTLLNTAISATIGVYSLSVGGLSPWASFNSVWVTWWIGDMLGALMVAPLILSWNDKKYIQIITDRIPEGVILFLSLVTVSTFVFGGTFSQAAYSLPYVIFPFIIWAALRFNMIGVATATFSVSVIAISSTLLNLGPFSVSGVMVEENLIALQVFMFIMATTSLLLAAAIHERKDAQAKVEESEQRFRALIEHSSDVVALTDANNRIIYLSPSTKRVLGYDPEELIGTMGLNLVYPEDLEETKKVVQESIKNPSKSVTYQARVVRKDKKIIWVESVRTNLLNNPSIRGMVSNFRDVTDHKEAEETLKNRAQELERINKVLVGRELKMAELKKEIEELKKKIIK